MNISMPTGLGAILAIIVLILAVIFVTLGQIDLKVGGLIAVLAIARLT